MRSAVGLAPTSRVSKAVSVRLPSPPRRPTISEPFTSKFDVANAVRDRLKDDPAMLEMVNRLLRVWNTDDDRSFEEFDPSKPHGADYKPDE